MLEIVGPIENSQLSLQQVKPFQTSHMCCKHSTNRFNLLLLCILLYFLSACGLHQSSSTASIDNTDEAKATMISTLEMLQDSTSTLEQVHEAFSPIIDRLWAESGDLGDLNKRLYAQKESLIYVYALTSWFDKQLGMGNNVTAKSINEILDPLTTIGSQWFCDPDGEHPYIWRELYYSSNRESEKPIDRYFKIMVILPDANDPAASAHIFFPKMAESAPRLYFSNYSDRAIGEVDYLHQETVDFDEDRWNPRHDAIPMAAFGGKDLVDKMLQYDVMYLAFRSSPTQSGGPGETEIAMMPLHSFHMAYDTVTNNQ